VTVPASPAIRVGVVGVSWAGQAAIKGFNALEDVKVVTLSGLESEQVEERGREHHVRHLFERWEDLVDFGDLAAPRATGCVALGFLPAAGSPTGRCPAAGR